MDFKKTKEPSLEIIRYRQEALRATGKGEEAAALCWRLAADAARNFLKQSQTNEILSLQESFFSYELAHLIQATQEAHARIQHQNPSPSIFEREESQEAAYCYRYWIAYSHAKNSNYYESEIFQTTQAAAKYQTIAPMVSFFAQEAVTYFKKAQEVQKATANSSLEIYPWKCIAYEALEVAMMHLHLEASISRNNKILIHHWKEAARYGEEAFYFRVKAALATQQKNVTEAIHCSLAAYAANNVCAAHAKLLEHFPSGKERLITHWIEVLHAAEKVVEERKKATVCKEKNYWKETSFWSEHYYDCSVKVAETYLPEHPMANSSWEKIMREAKHVASCWDRAALQKSNVKNYFVRKIFNCSWQKKAVQEEQFYRKKFLKFLRTEIFFCMPQELLLYAMNEKNRYEKKFIDGIEFTIFYNWIYQTWKFLREAGVPCCLSTQPITCGIMITLCEGLPPTFGKESSQSGDVFLVDVVADGKQHPAADFYLFQNQNSAQRSSNAHFIPHWPQTNLIPRDPSRGNRFENICFLGERCNLAPELLSPAWKEKLQQHLGLHFEIRNKHQWHDYHNVDCVIAIRDFCSQPHFSKPATKLYNAWLAGVPFIGGSDSAYAADGHCGKDYLVATSPEELFQHLQRLKEDLVFRALLIEQGRKASTSFSKEATLERWKSLTQEILPQHVF